MMWKFCGKAQAIRPKLCGNCAFPQNFHTMKLGEITVFYAVPHKGKPVSDFSEKNPSYFISSSHMPSTYSYFIEQHISTIHSTSDDIANIIKGFALKSDYSDKIHFGAIPFENCYKKVSIPSYTLNLSPHTG